MSDITSLTDPNNPTVIRWRNQAPELLHQAESLEIQTDDDLANAADLTRLTTSAVKGIKDLFKPAKQSIDNAKRVLTALETSLIEGFEKADTILRRKCTSFNVERMRQRDVERRRLEAEAIKKAEDDKLAEALRLEQLGKATGDQHYIKSADQVLSTPVRATVHQAPVTKVKGMSFREEVGADVHDFDALVDAVLAGKVERAALLPNLAWLKAEAQQRGVAFDIPGVTRTVTNDVTVRR
jgi:hypothetical protein